MIGSTADVVDAYIDLRSPYSYLAIAPARALEAAAAVPFRWWPYLTDFQSAYGGEVHERAPRDVAKLKYLYADCRRLAEAQGLTIRATTKLWDARLGSRAMLYARENGRLWEFLTPVLRAFWAREFDLESVDAIERALGDAQLSATDWSSHLARDADAALADATERATTQGVFGAPTFVFRQELFWGGDRLGLLADRLARSSTHPPVAKVAEGR